MSLFRPNINPASHLQPADETTEAKLQKKLTEIELENKEKEAQQKADKFHLSYIDLRKIPIAQDSLILMSEEQSQALQAAVFLFLDNTIRLATTNPQNPQLAAKVKELEDTCHARVELYFVSDQSLQKALDKFATIPHLTDSGVGGLEIKTEDLEKYHGNFRTFAEVNEIIKTAALTDAVTVVIASALEAEASDIHIEAEEAGVKIRFRVDGVLHEVTELPVEAWSKLISRLKLVSRLKLNITTQPQDGRFTIVYQNQKIEVRVSTVPTTYGESVVMRLLRSGVETFKFETLGLRGKAYNDLLGQIRKPNGMVIATGPTGSGKTTTLYALMNLLNTPERKMITLEDPVEYKIPGINQSQVDTTHDYSFSSGLRSILRQDPDTIMVGEIRDLETAEVAIQAALTGHLMLSTMHTNSAAGAIPRLLAMGVKPYLLAPAINAIEAQRLVRRLCQKCKKTAELDNTTMTLVLNEIKRINPQSGITVDNLGSLVFYTAPGCEECHGLGYKGRVGLFEVFTMTQAIEKVILNGNVSEFDLQNLAIDSGMITMLQDGILKALDGMTSVEEVLKKTE